MKEKNFEEKKGNQKSKIISAKDKNKINQNKLVTQGNILMKSLYVSYTKY